MVLEKATLEDLDRVISFYNEVIDHTPDIGKYARWSRGKHPTEEGLGSAIGDGCMYLGEEDGVLVGAMVLTMSQGEEYRPVEWSRRVADDEVAVLHLLAVSPLRQGRGVGSEMVREAIGIASRNGKKTIRLDALSSNVPAHRLYERLGFAYRGKRHLYAENTGWTDFFFFEYEGEMIISELDRRGRDEAVELVRTVFMQFEAPDYGEEGVEEFMRTLDDESYLLRHRFFGAFSDGKLAGVIATRNDHHHIALLFVGGEHQRRGIGRTLVGHVLSLKDEAPVTVNSSPYAHPFYLKMGFRDTEGERVTNGIRYYPMIKDE